MVPDAAPPWPGGTQPAPAGSADSCLEILLVEDDPEDVRLLLDLIPSRAEPDVELRFTVARTIEEATTALEAHRFDAIALDLSLPDAKGLNGLHTLRRAAPQVPVVVVTGAQNYQLARRAIAAGAQDYLAKGVDAANAFSRSIRHAIERQRLLRERDEVAALLRQRAEQLMAANARLTAAADARDELVAVVSHELRTPLTPITGFAETLHRSLSGQVTPDELEMLDAIARNAHRLRAHVEQLLSVSRLAGDMGRRSDRATIEVAGLLRRLANDQLGADAGVSYDAAPQLTIYLTALHAEQILSNLLVNARKYGRPPIELSARADGAYTVISVADHGDGVPAAFVPNLFDRFSQASTGTRRTASGVGLGLHVARQLALLHGGQLTYEPRDDLRGARFVLRLPATSASAPASGDAGRAAAVDSDAMKLTMLGSVAARRMLRAEDEVAVVEVVEATIAELGGSVVPADVATPDALPVDVSLGLDSPRVVIPADAFAKAQIQRLLPGVLDDARRALSMIRDRRHPPAGPEDDA